LNDSSAHEEEWIAMATAAQIEANRRNSKKSTGPRAPEGRNKSRFNALDHGCRANILVLPTEEFGDYENQYEAWKLSFKPRNPAEEFLIEGIVSLGCLTKRIDQAETARLISRQHYGIFEENAKVEREVLELGQKLLKDACGPQALHLEDKVGERQAGHDGELHRVSDYDNAEDHPMRLVDQLRATGSGCEWLLDRWAQLRELLEQGMPWLAPDKLKAVRLLGRHPIDAYDYPDVARIYLASYVLLNEEGEPFQEILNELYPGEGSRYEHYLRMRRYDLLAPKDAAAARLMLLEIVDRASAELEADASVYRELAQTNLKFASHRLSWDDTPEGERLRRYGLTCKRTKSRMFDLLLKIRATADELDIATVASIRRSVPTVTTDAIDEWGQFDEDAITLPDEPALEADPPAEEPVPPNEANSAAENAPNEPNSHVQATSPKHRDAVKEVRIDTPHVERKAHRTVITGKETIHPAIERVLGGGKSTLMNLSPIFSEQ
jgi:hypothetical protein